MLYSWNLINYIRLTYKVNELLSLIGPYPVYNLELFIEGNIILIY